MANSQFQPPTGKLSVNTTEALASLGFKVVKFQPPTGKLSVNTEVVAVGDMDAYASFQTPTGKLSVNTPKTHQERICQAGVSTPYGEIEC